MAPPNYNIILNWSNYLSFIIKNLINVFELFFLVRVSCGNFLCQSNWLDWYYNFCLSSSNFLNSQLMVCSFFILNFLVLVMLENLQLIFQVSILELLPAWLIQFGHFSCRYLNYAKDFLHFQKLNLSVCDLIHIVFVIYVL